jgi:hypothetical protein
MNRKLVLSLAAAVLLIGCSLANASIEAVGDPIEGGSWSHEFQVQGPGKADFMGVVMLSAGDAFEPPVFSNFHASGWTGSGNSQAGIASGPLETTLTFDISFAGSTNNPLEFLFESFNGETWQTKAKLKWKNPGWTIEVEYGDVYTRGEIEDMVPEPATIIIWSLLGAGSWLGMGVWRRRRPVGRQPWSPEARQAIHEIIAR